MERTKNCTKRKIRKLSLDFCKDARKDLAKTAIIQPKIILEGLSLWPGKENWAMKLYNYGLLISLCFMFWGHISYVINNITDVPIMARACTTIFSTLQTACKLVSLRRYKVPLNDILCNLWDNFWPVELATEATKKTIRGNIMFVKAICMTYFCIAIFSVTLFMSYPLVLGNEMLPLATIFPFSYASVPLFEIMYVWQYFSHYFVVCVLSGHDFLFSAIVINVVAQFQILKDVLKHLHASNGGEEIRRKICQYLGVTEANGGISVERQLLLKCVKHHILLLVLCKEVEKCFSMIIFIQFFVSSIALCVSSLVLTTNPSEMGNMFTYVTAHLLQLFIFCAMGNELMLQSTQIGDAAVECGYEKSFDKHLRFGLVMLIQRSQRAVNLTALGFTALNYASFVMLLRVSFSFYTMLDSFKD